MANPRAIVLMIAAMAFFAVSDALIKLAAETIEIGQILAITSLGSVLMFAPLILREKASLFSANLRNRAFLIRTSGEVLGSFGFVTALSLIPLSTASAIMQAQPLVMTLAAAVFLGETVGWRRWIAVALGLFGVMIILRPGMQAFDPNTLWMILAIAGLTARDVGTRMLPRHISTAFVSVWAMLCLALLGIALMTFQGGWLPVDAITWIWLFGISAAVTGAFLTITASLRAGEISAIAPFRYTRIVFALLIAYVIFNEALDIAAWIGVFLIIGSGLYAFWRERQVQSK